MHHTFHNMCHKQYKGEKRRRKEKWKRHRQTGIDFRKAMYSIHTGPDAMSVPDEFKNISDYLANYNIKV